MPSQAQDSVTVPLQKQVARINFQVESVSEESAENGTRSIVLHSTIAKGLGFEIVSSGDSHQVVAFQHKPATGERVPRTEGLNFVLANIGELLFNGRTIEKGDELSFSFRSDTSGYRYLVDVLKIGEPVR